MPAEISLAFAGALAARLGPVRASYFGCAAPVETTIS